jgi:predicted nuclease of predicted toxin-antitoxin system
MRGFLIDVNLPYRFSLWSGEDFEHMRDVGEAWTDTQIWRYAQERDLVIVSKDTDFSDRVLVTGAPPRVVHVRLGNMRMADLHGLISRLWPQIVELSATNRLVTVYRDRIEAIE